jgi:hypothetical protein
MNLAGGKFRGPRNSSRVDAKRGDHFLQPDLRLLISVAEHPSTALFGARVELGTERESLLQVLDENADFGGQPAAGKPYGRDWHCSFKGSQKTDNCTFSEFRGEEPCRRLGNPQMFQDTHAHLFDIAGPKDSCGDNTLRVLSRAKAPRLYGAPLDKNDRSKAPEFFRRCRRAVAREVLRSDKQQKWRIVLKEDEPHES